MIIQHMILNKVSKQFYYKEKSFPQMVLEQLDIVLIFKKLSTRNSYLIPHKRLIWD